MQAILEDLALGEDVASKFAREKVYIQRRYRFIRGEPVKCRIDEEDMFVDCLAFYKRPDFDPCRPIRVVMKSQPAIDTGGVRRHFFS